MYVWHKLKKMTSEKYSTLGKGTAVISFVIGALIFGIYLLTSNSNLLFIGYGFIVLAGIANLIILIAILAKSNSDSTNRKRLLKTSGLMLINLPIMFFFIWISLILIGNMRITLTNGTNNKLTDIKIVGCETQHIAELEPNESKTVWVEITGDCSITLEYLENGEIKKEMVEEFIDYYSKNICVESKLLVGVENFLKWSKNNNISLGVCTNKQEYLAVKLLKKIKINHYFEYVAGSNTFEYCKPDPRHLTNVIEIMQGNLKNSLMIGDSETDAETARSAGVPFILIENGYTEKKTSEIYHDHLIKDFVGIEQIISKYINH